MFYNNCLWLENFSPVVVRHADVHEGCVMAESQEPHSHAVEDVDHTWINKEAV